MTSVKHQLRDLAIKQLARVTRAPATGQGDSVLVFQPDHLGDIILAQPAVRLLRERYHDRKLVGVVGPWSQSIARAVWPVDEIVTIDFPGFQRSTRASNPLSPYAALLDAAASLRHFHAGTAYILRPDAWWAAWLASMVTTGDVVTAADPRMEPFATQMVPLREGAHATERAIAIACDLEPPSPVLTPEEYPLSFPTYPDAAATARTLRARLGVETPYVVIHPGSGAEVKLWPAVNWRNVVRQLIADGLPVIVTGSTSEQGLAREIVCDNAGAHSLAGQTPLSVLAEIMRDAALVAGPDSGPLHLAVACGTPSVHLFGPSDPQRYGPWGPASRHRVIASDWTCPRCGDLSPSRKRGCGCMLSIQVDHVVETIREMLERDAT